MKKREKNSGFTFIELLVVIAIIGILTTVIFVSARGSQKQLALSRATNRLAQDIRRAQAMAMSAKECKDTACAAAYKDKVPPGGYGISITTSGSSYILYADGGNEQYGGSDDSDIETINLEQDISFSLSSATSASINFKPPDPKTQITEDGGQVDETSITLAVLGSLATRSVTVNTAGRINIE